ncbi:MAG: acyl-CoA dehydrogenase [Sinimarinibacterium flocculans]|uniref:acyl-CoA dehydrogenase n=1 Tax=Sinimarinibacterium flocculans TaxID=985250 RepID=UPI003C50BAA5
MQVNRRDLDFLLYELLDVESLCEHPLYAEHSRESFDAMLDAAARLAMEKFANHNARADAHEPHIVDGKVVLIPEVKQAIDAYIDQGFLSATFAPEYGGVQLPFLVSQAVAWFFHAANACTVGYPFLTMAASNLLAAHASETQKDRYMRPMIDGRFFGTMCLSEPQAGSSLSDIRTTATPVGDGRYRLKGTKMWISGGEHELGENIVHLVLAKIPGGPPGTKGISLFIVPRYRLDDAGRPAENNNVVLAGLNHKMGYRGTVNTLLNFGESGDCYGELIGEAHKGLSFMFHMMNEARIAVGFNAAVQGCSAYQHSLQYARERPQGRSFSNRDATQPQMKIVEHPDVKRMLLTQKAYAEGAVALCLYGAKLVDERAASDDADQQQALLLELEILTPIIKAWSSHYCLEANYWAIQILGGYGYTRDYPVEQIYRDNRLNPIHEGTNGIQSFDLLGRKVTMHGGAAFKLLMRRLGKTAETAAQVDALAEHAQALKAATRIVTDTTSALVAAAAQDTDRFLCNSWIYLEMLGHTVIAWIWLEQALAAHQRLSENAPDRDFYQAKINACRFFFRWELPKIERQAALLSGLDDTLLTVDAQAL